MPRDAGEIARELMDEPHLAGRRISVRRLHALVAERDLDPRAVAHQLELDLADVYRALAYYHDNPEEMREVERRRERRVEQSLERGAVSGPADL